MKKLTESDKQEIVAYHREGKSEREIARMIGCSRTAVWTVLQREKQRA